MKLTVEKEPSPIIFPKMKSSAVALRGLPPLVSEFLELEAPVEFSVADSGRILGEVILKKDSDPVTSSS